MSIGNAIIFLLQIKKTSLCKMGYFPKQYTDSGTKIKVK